MTLSVGLTFDLRDDYRRRGYTAEQTAEFDSLVTITAIEDALTLLGCRTDRIGSIHDLVDRLAQGHRWDLVFNIAEGLRGLGRESQVPALLDAYDIPYTFSDPMVLALTLHKGMAKRVVRDLGLPTPDFVVVDAAADVEGVDLPFPVFVKPVSLGTSMGIDGGAIIHDRDALSRRCLALLDRFRQPVLVEAYLPGRELTVGLVGSGRDARVLGVMEILLQSDAEPGVYTYDNKAQYVDRVGYALVSGELAEEAREVALGVWRGLGCRDTGRVDLRCDASGQVNFIEANPLAGLHPIDADLVILCRLMGIDHRTLIATILESARRRLPHVSDSAPAAPPSAREAHQA